MVAPAHVRLTWSGVFGTKAAPSEEWSFGLGVATPNGQPSRANLEAMSLAASNAWSDIAGITSSAVRLTRTRAAYVSESAGRLLTVRDDGGAYLQEDQDLDVGGSATATKYPFQVSLAVSTHSDFAGPLGRGRFYVPSPVYVVASDGLLDSTTQNTLRGVAKTFLDGLNSDLVLLNGAYLAIASGGSVLRAVPAAMRQITGVSVGRRLDIQRRRANDQPESRSITALAEVGGA